MIEISTIGSTVWATQEVEAYPYMRPGCALSRAFYDPRTGEVWGKRVVMGAQEIAWVYTPRPKTSHDLTYPWEWEQDCVPTGLLAAIVVGIREE